MTHLLITGGAGFIGINTADHFLAQGHQVTLYDNLSRKGGQSNIAWLRERHGEQFSLIVGDVRHFDPLAEVMQQEIDGVIHLAGQVAVTTSVQNPREDFESNALGTFNVLEAIRQYRPQAAMLYASTNKVYGGMEEVGIVDLGERYGYAAYNAGIPESYPIDFHSPYGCSKGAGDQYVRDYARIYGLKTIVFRQSCIYGPRQFGIEDQGWVAHFVIAAVLGRNITIFGDGKQVRDLLHVTDLIRAYELGLANADKLAGGVFNLGGGPQNTLAVWSEFGPMLNKLVGKKVPATFGDWRPGDQKVFVANIEKAAEQLGWQPLISPQKGIAQLVTWVKENKTLFG